MEEELSQPFHPTKLIKERKMTYNLIRDRDDVGARKDQAQRDHCVVAVDGPHHKVGKPAHGSVHGPVR